MKSANRVGERASSLRQKPRVVDQVATMRAEIERIGESVVGREELILLSDEVSQSEELNGIAQIAEWERWTFQYLPDGNVRFSTLESAAAQRRGAGKAAN